jgi:hypothetical protein
MLVPDAVDRLINNALEEKKHEIIKKRWEVVRLQALLDQLQEQDKNTDRQQA